MAFNGRHGMEMESEYSMEMAVESMEISETGVGVVQHQVSLKLV